MQAGRGKREAGRARTPPLAIPPRAHRCPFPASRFPPAASRPLREPSVTRRENVRRILGAVKTEEEFLDVAIQTALAHLIGFDLDERVVPALGLRRELECAERTGVRARPRRGRVLREADLGKERVGGVENVGRRNVTAIEMSH